MVPCVTRASRASRARSKRASDACTYRSVARNVECPMSAAISCGGTQRRLTTTRTCVAGRATSATAPRARPRSRPAPRRGAEQVDGWAIRWTREVMLVELQDVQCSTAGAWLVPTDGGDGDRTARPRDEDGPFDVELGQISRTYGVSM